ncbi:MAG: NAD(P)/FAD-dependent oxidoreductase [Streptosporangiaceae bacterium]
MATETTYVIVGASLAGAKAAETLREQGFDGRVMLIGAESERPYERPPLSKDYLLGKADRSDAFVHDEGWYTDHDVKLRLGVRATRVDRASHELELAAGERVRYDKLLLATGASPRRLPVPGGDLDGVFYLRTIADSERLREAFHAGGRVVVVGAGWIGLETAAAARSYGCEVAVIEPERTPLYRSIGAELGEMFAGLHRDHDVTLRLGESVTQIRGEGGRAHEVVTSVGESLPAHTVVVGVGAGPNTTLAEEAGLDVENGVLVDQTLRSSDPDIYAAGDVARAYNPLLGQRIRVEHWANALDGGPAAARTMLGGDVVYDKVPYFFSDQYDLGMEYAGHAEPGGYDEVVYRGDRRAGEFVAFWLSDGRVVAGMNVNVWDVTDQIQALIRAGRPVDKDRLTDTSVPLDSL